MKANNSAHILLLDPGKKESRLLRHEHSKPRTGFKCEVDILTTRAEAMNRSTDKQCNRVPVVAAGHEVMTETEKLELAADRYAQHNSNFEDTTYMVLAGLSAIIEKLDIIAETDPTQLKQLADQAAMSGDEEKMPTEKISAVERLLLSLLTKQMDSSIESPGRI
jgi:hypothetical protein